MKEENKSKEEDNLMDVDSPPDSPSQQNIMTTLKSRIRVLSMYSNHSRWSSQGLNVHFLLSEIELSK